uniref:ATP synthase F0 subunit 8 n=1 Tax=Trichuris sp. GHL-2013 TaxID=1305677 RepID=S4U204_9BILA|nr:ATP synthase F0 subunit 8 [Trichuris sp. GHL-2013]
MPSLILLLYQISPFSGTLTLMCFSGIIFTLWSKTPPIKNPAVHLLTAKGLEAFC